MLIIAIRYQTITLYSFNHINDWLFVFTVTAEGKVYACGEATNGRLGLGLSSGTIPIPRQISALSNYVVKKVAVHSGMPFIRFKENILCCQNVLF